MNITNPNARKFFKYSSPETALAVLQNKTFRYNSPLNFNDPFDLQSGLHFNFDINSLYLKVLDRLEQLITTTEAPLFDENDPGGKIILLARKNFSAKDFPRKRWEQLFKEPIYQLVLNMIDFQKNYQEGWRDMLPRFRIFCVSEERDNLLMWAHYAKDHKGVVFELRSLPEQDNPLSVAKPVIYVDKPPSLFTDSEWVEHILFGKRPNDSDLYNHYVQIKSNHWSYEREWRVAYPLAEKTDSSYSDCPINPSELSCIYIGCRAETDFTTEIIKLTRQSFPAVRIFQAYKDVSSYALCYKEIEPH